MCCNAQFHGKRCLPNGQTSRLPEEAAPKTVPEHRRGYARAGFHSVMKWL
jgi:hypothetical protein